MTWNLTRIPRIIHFFWDNRPLSFLRWMSLHSFSALNPDWEIQLHVAPDDIRPNWSGPSNKHHVTNDYRDWLSKVPNLTLVEESELPLLPGVQRSDILRNKYLFDQGGVWSDIDIIYHQPITRLDCNDPSQKDYDCGLCYTARWFPIAFMLGGENSNFFRAVFDTQLRLLKTFGRGRNYQQYGTKIYSGAFRAHSYRHIQIHPKEVYQKYWRQHGEIFAGSVALNTGIGIHWYGGSPSAARYEPEIHHENWRDYPIRKMIEITYEQAR